MKALSLFFVLHLIGCSNVPIHDSEYDDSDMECLLAEVDNDKRTVCKLKE